MTQSIYLQYKFTSLNQYMKIERGRNGKYAANRVKQDETNFVAYSVKGKLEKIENKVDVTFIWYESGRRKDPDNIAFCCKYVFDGLVKAGILINDNHKYINSITHKFDKCIEDAVKIILTEVI